MGSNQPAGPRAGGPWWRQLPGFRSGKAWRMVVGSAVYLFLLYCLSRITTNVFLGLCAIVSLAAILIGFDAFGLRRRLPLFRSAHQRRAGAAWSLVSLLLLTFGIGALEQLNTTPTKVARHSAVAARPSPALSPSRTPVPVSSPSPAPSPSPTPSTTPTPTPRPVTPSPTAQPVAAVTPNLCGATANPWGYNFCGGAVIYDPPADFCDYFDCIESFWRDTNGYVEECADGTYSHSGGREGACSYHGGELRPLYA
jgi:hypothetical protein